MGLFLAINGQPSWDRCDCPRLLDYMFFFASDFPADFAAELFFLLPLREKLFYFRLFLVRLHSELVWPISFQGLNNGLRHFACSHGCRIIRLWL